MPSSPKSPIKDACESCTECNLCRPGDLLDTIFDGHADPARMRTSDIRSALRMIDPSWPSRQDFPSEARHDKAIRAHVESVLKMSIGALMYEVSCMQSSHAATSTSIKTLCDGCDRAPCRATMYVEQVLEDRDFVRTLAFCDADFPDKDDPQYKDVKAYESAMADHALERASLFAELLATVVKCSLFRKP